jgi:hypothetical protein
MRYRLTKGLLALSANVSLLGLLEDPESGETGQFSGAGGLPQLRIDLTRQSKIKDSLVNGLTAAESVTHDDVRQYLELEFPGCAHRLINKYSQGPTYLVSGALGGHSLAAGLDSVIGQPDKNGSDDSRNFYYRNGHFYLKHTIKRLPIISQKKNGEIIGYIEGPIEALFKESQNGFELQYIDTDNKWVCDLLMGYPYQEPDNLNWLQKNSVVFQPVYENVPIIPLSHRIYEAFHSTYSNNDAHQSDFAAFMGWPENYNAYSIVEYALGGFVFSPLKNSVKLITEFTPFILEVSAHWAIDQLKANYPDEKTIPKPLLRYTAQAASTLAIGLLGAIYYVAKAARFLLRTVSSPIKSFQEGWKIHPLLGIASGMITLAAVITISIFTAPATLLVIGKIAGAGAAGTVAAVAGKAASLPVFSQLGTVLSPVVAALGKVAGVTLPATVSKVAACIGIMINVAGTPLKAGALKISGWLSQQLARYSISKRLRHFKENLPSQKKFRHPVPKPRHNGSTSLIFHEVPPGPPAQIITADPTDIVLPGTKDSHPVTMLTSVDVLPDHKPPASSNKCIQYK